MWGLEDWDWGTAAACLLILLMVVGILLGALGWLAPRVIDEALSDAESMPDEDAHWPEDPDHNSDPTIRHALRLARRPGSIVLLTMSSAYIYPMRGISVCVVRSQLTPAEDRYLRSRVR